MTNLDTRYEVQALLDAVLPEFLRPAEAAAILRLSRETLDRYRITGGGPAYYMFGTAVVCALAESKHLPVGRALIRAMSCRDSCHRDS